MVTPSLPLSFERSKYYAPNGASPHSYSRIAELLYAEFLYIYYLFKIPLLPIKKGTLKNVPSRYQSTEDTLVALTNINLRS